MLRDCAPSKSGCGRASRWLCGFELALQWDGRFSSEKRPKLRRSVPTHACTTPATHTHRRPGNTRTGAEAPDQRPKECPPGGRRDWFKPNAPIYIECTSRGDIPPPPPCGTRKDCKARPPAQRNLPYTLPAPPLPILFLRRPPCFVELWPGAEALFRGSLSLSSAGQAALAPPPPWPPLAYRIVWPSGQPRTSM